jgi:hypothetical protein
VETLVHFEKDLIAPCGINCGTCIAYLREKRNRCHGCHHSDLNIPKTRLNCNIKNCEHLQKTDSKLCYECHLFPCSRLKHLDKRYRTNYRTSLIQNLDTIKETGLIYYLESEVRKWSCPNCGSIISVHRENCLKCGIDLKKEFLK